MGLTQCSDPHNSPYGRSGQLCPVAPLRCLECRNAWVLPSNLPQLLLFADHLDRLRLRLSPQHFAELWGQSHANLQAVLAERTDEEKALARKHIDAGEVGPASAAGRERGVRQVSLVQLNALPSGVFDAHEPVIGSHPLLAEAPVPRFGDAVEWNLNGVIRRPARLPACGLDAGVLRRTGRAVVESAGAGVQHDHVQPPPPSGHRRRAFAETRTGQPDHGDQRS